MTDIINGFFELSGAIFVLISIIKTIKAKKSHGISYWTTGFFTAWGLWNIHLYSYIGFTLSFYGGLLLSATNVYWLILIIKYRKP